MTENQQYCFTTEEYIANINKIKDYLLEELKNDNIISPETQKTVSKTYYLNIIKPSWLSRFTKKEEVSKITNIIVTKIRENVYEEK